MKYSLYHSIKHWLVNILALGLVCSSAHAGHGFKDVAGAWYGLDKGNKINVTSKASNQVKKEDYLKAPANMNEYFGQDPIPGTVKTAAFHLIFDDGYDLHLRCPEHHYTNFYAIYAQPSQDPKHHGGKLTPDNNPDIRRIPPNFPALPAPAEMELGRVYTSSDKQHINDIHNNHVIPKLKQILKEYGFIYIPDWKAFLGEQNYQTFQAEGEHAVYIHIFMRNIENKYEILDFKFVMSIGTDQVIIYPTTPENAAKHLDGTEKQPTEPVMPAVAATPVSDSTIAYGDVLRINFRALDLRLHAWNQPYRHPGTSGQFQVSAWAYQDDNDLFKVLGPDGTDEDYMLGQPVKAESTIRLKHMATGHNLHSHTQHMSPGNHGYEVTLFQHGKDSNDNWNVLIDGKSAGQNWDKADNFRLFHVNTSSYLYLPGPKFDVREGTGLGGSDLQYIIAAKATAGTPSIEVARIISQSPMFVKDITQRASAPEKPETTDTKQDTPTTVVKGPEGHEWALGSKKVPGGSNILCKKDDKWMGIDGGLVKLAVGKKGILWGVNENDDIFYRDGISASKPEGTAWIHVQGKLKSIFITPFGTVYGKNAANEFFVSFSGDPKNPAWEKQEQDATKFTYAPDIQGLDVKTYHSTWKLPEKGKGSVIFKALCYKDVHVNLAPNQVDEKGKMYELVIGGWENTQTVVYEPEARAQNKQEFMFQSKAVDALIESGLGKSDKPVMHEYWVSYDNGKITAGRGSTIGENTFIDVKDDTPFEDIQYIGLGGWNNVVKFQDIKIVGAAQEKEEAKEEVKEAVKADPLDQTFFNYTRSNFFKQLIKNTQQKHTINYGDIIELNHVYGNVQIHANNAFKYNNEGGSGQVQVQGWSVPGDESNFFIVKGPDGQDDKEGPVKSGDTIRLEHKVSKMNLHSHASHQSPNDFGAEVTLFGSDSKGDSNDNWVVMVMDDDQFGNPSKIGTEWTTRDSVNFFHHNTSTDKNASNVSNKSFLTWGGQKQMFDVWKTNDKDSTKSHLQYELAGTDRESHWFVSAFHKDSPEKKTMTTAAVPPKKVTQDEKKEADKERKGDEKVDPRRVVRRSRTRRRRGEVAEVDDQARSARSRQVRDRGTRSRGRRRERGARGTSRRESRSVRGRRGQRSRETSARDRRGRLRD
ncbi:MAG: hypothetical protein H6679_00380 [Epsilonproteobacteria bacterium]|nr:hypothetical protein [Campylobacterota bacterium]